jgi:hypothetical protein
LGRVIVLPTKYQETACSFTSTHEISYIATHALLTAIQFAVVPVATEFAATPDAVCDWNALDEDELCSDTHEPSTPTAGSVKTFDDDDDRTKTYLFTSVVERVEFEPSERDAMD